MILLLQNQQKPGISPTFNYYGIWLFCTAFSFHFIRFPSIQYISSHNYDQIPYEQSHEYHIISYPNPAGHIIFHIFRVFSFSISIPTVTPVRRPYGKLYCQCSMRKIWNLSIFLPDLIYRSIQLLQTVKFLKVKKVILSSCISLHLSCMNSKLPYRSSSIPQIMKYFTCRAINFLCNISCRKSCLCL